MKKIMAMIVVLLFLISGCDNRHNALLVKDGVIYLQHTEFSIDSFDEKSQERIKSIKKFSTRVLIGVSLFGGKAELYILE